MLSTTSGHSADLAGPELIWGGPTRWKCVLWSDVSRFQICEATFQCWRTTHAALQTVCFSDVTAYPSKTVKPHSAYDSVAAVQTRPPLKNMWCFMKHQTQQQSPWTTEKLKLLIKKDFQRISLSILQELESNWRHFNCPNLFETINNKVYQCEHWMSLNRSRIWSANHCILFLFLHFTQHPSFFGILHIFFVSAMHGRRQLTCIGFRLNEKHNKILSLI